jgi:hypothetical protein
MSILEQKISLNSACSLIKKSNDHFAPIREAVANSLDAIKQRQDIDKNFIPLVSVAINIESKKLLLNEAEDIKFSLNSISIEDNGIGFTSENLSRFKNLADNSKNLNNRGTGKIQIFHRFNKILINSIFCENNIFKKLNVELEKVSGEYKENITENDIQENTGTMIEMKEFTNKKESVPFIKYLDDGNLFKQDILKHFLLRLWLGNKEEYELKLTIKIFLDGEQKYEYIFNKENIPQPDLENDIIVNTKQGIIVDNNHIEWNTVKENKLTIRRFNFSANTMNENNIYKCSKNIVVKPFAYQAIKKTTSFNGFRYLTSISGDIFDDPRYINQSVDDFNFASKKETEKKLLEGSFFEEENQFIFEEEIKDKIVDGLDKTYSDIKDLKEDRDKNIIELAEKYGISKEDAEAANIGFNETEEEAIKKLFEEQSKRFAKESIEIQETYKELKELEIQKLDPTSNQYQAKFKKLSDKLLEKIPQQNKDELTRYIIRRDMVVELLKLALNSGIAIQKEWAEKKISGERVRQDNEGIIHDIIFKRRMKDVPNDLWILNEEFVHFNGYSDTKLEDLEINGEKLLQDNMDIERALKSVGIDKDTYIKQRPDIFLFPEEGKCILVEFKAPEVDLAKHTTQIPRYAKLVANYSRKPKYFTQFFGFLIGENIDTVGLTSEWKKVPFGNYRVYPSLPITSIDEAEAPIANLYQEIIPLSELAKRANIRNKSFADKLGLKSEDLEKIEKTE